ncbi:MAG: hypothetical protein KatS3mg092_0810 [Patescibacteria group bacterium]|nr:MAG: hypothetical protein KatS3mg092_0810 [Patescibacteria group bacterium]
MDEAIVYSTYKLSNDELESLIKKIPQLKKYQIKNIVDKSIIAGIVIKFSDKIIDLSLKNRLKIIFQKLYEQI